MDELKWEIVIQKRHENKNPATGNATQDRTDKTIFPRWSELRTSFNEKALGQGVKW